MTETNNGASKLADRLALERAQRGWTQMQLAHAAAVSIDSVRRIEAGTYVLPTRPRESGHSLDRIVRALGMDICQLVLACYSKEEIASTDYRRCIQSGTNTITDSTPSSPSRNPPLQAYIDSLPKDRDTLVAIGQMLNAHAIAFLIALERAFGAFEFLVTNQPPFMLFADDEYITTGSSSVELPPVDRDTYHSLIFEHRAWLRARVVQGSKHYRTVLHKQSLIAFLNARSKVRATSVVSDMKGMLRYDGFDLVIVENAESFDEFEILSANYPLRVGGHDAISIRHRRVGLHNTGVYQLALIGTNNELVWEDYTRADVLWRNGLMQCEEQPPNYSEYMRQTLPLKHKRIAAHLLDDALAVAHPSS